MKANNKLREIDGTQNETNKTIKRHEVKEHDNHCVLEHHET